jgi:hypothetical protein
MPLGSIFIRVVAYARKIKILAVWSAPYELDGAAPDLIKSLDKTHRARAPATTGARGTRVIR